MAELGRLDEKLRKGVETVSSIALRLKDLNNYDGARIESLIP